MKIEAENNSIIIKEAFSGVTIETREGKRLNICLRDFGYDVNIDGGKWFHIDSEKDFGVYNQIPNNEELETMAQKYSDKIPMTQGNAVHEYLICLNAFKAGFNAKNLSGVSNTQSSDAEMAKHGFISGEDARRFQYEMDNVIPASADEIARIKKNYEIIMAKYNKNKKASD